MPITQTRRRFMAALSLAATGGLIRPLPAAGADIGARPRDCLRAGRCRTLPASQKGCGLCRKPSNGRRAARMVFFVKAEGSGGRWVGAVKNPPQRGRYASADNTIPTPLSDHGLAGWRRQCHPRAPCNGSGGAARNDRGPAREVASGYLHWPAIRRRRSAARRRLYRYPIRPFGVGRTGGGGGRKRLGGFQLELCRAEHHRCRRWRTACDPCRRACRLLRIVWTRGNSKHYRSQREKRGCPTSGLEPACVSGHDARLYRARSRQGHHLGHEHVAQAERTFR